MGEIVTMKFRETTIAERAVAKSEVSRPAFHTHHASGFDFVDYGGKPISRCGGSVIMRDGGKVAVSMRATNSSWDGLGDHVSAEYTVSFERHPVPEGAYGECGRENLEEVVGLHEGGLARVRAEIEASRA